MPKIGISTRDLDSFAQTIRDTLTGIESAERFAGWLRSQPSVVSVRMADHLIKTEPPRKALWVTFQMQDGSISSYEIVVILNPDQTLRLAGMKRQ